MSRLRRRIIAATMALLGAVAQATRLLRSKRTVAALLLPLCLLTAACKGGAVKSQTGPDTGCKGAAVVVTKIYASRQREYCGLTNVGDLDLKLAFEYGGEVIEAFKGHKLKPLRIVIAGPSRVAAPNGGYWDTRERVLRLRPERVRLDYVARGVAYAILAEVAPSLGEGFDESGAVRVAFGDTVAGFFVGRLVVEDRNGTDVDRDLLTPEHYGDAVHFREFDPSNTPAATKHNSTILSRVMFQLTATLADQQSLAIDAMEHLPKYRPARFSDVRVALIEAAKDTSVRKRVKEAFDKVGVTAR